MGSRFLARLGGQQGGGRFVITRLQGIQEAPDRLLRRFRGDCHGALPAASATGALAVVAAGVVALALELVSLLPHPLTDAMSNAAASTRIRSVFFMVL